MDKIVEREELKETLAMILRLHKKAGERTVWRAWEREHAGEVLLRRNGPWKESPPCIGKEPPE